VTSSYLALEQAVQARQTQLLMEAQAERLASRAPRRAVGWRRSAAAGLYALAGWLNTGAVDAKRGWTFPQACADWCNGVEYWCAFPPPLVH
jgi:hypothetical protein